MTSTSLAVFMAAIMVVGVLGTGFAQDAGALKSKNTASVTTDICGLSLCSEYPGGKTAYEAEWVSTYRSTGPVLQQVKETEDIHHDSVSSENAGMEFPAKLDEVIHKFELDKISAEEAMAGITEVYDEMIRLTITSDIVEAVGEKIALYNSGTLEAADAVEAVHLTAEPQNVDPEFIGAVEAYTYQFELGDISAEEAIVGITEVYDEMIGLTITSELIENVGQQLVIYENGAVSIEFTMEEIDEIIEEAELAIQSDMSGDTIPEMKELPPNTIDIPAGTGVPGCEVDNWCYMQADFTAHVGDTITWINSDTLPHTVTSGSGDADAVGLDVPNGFDSGFMSAGDEFEHTFDVAGVYDYYCQLHPWMEASVTVK